MKHSAMIGVGVAIMLAALWSGSFAMELFDYNDWRKFPSLITCISVFGGGFLLTLRGINA